jgi:hypothetical protein
MKKKIKVAEKNNKELLKEKAHILRQANVAEEKVSQASLLLQLRD